MTAFPWNELNWATVPMTGFNWAALDWAAVPDVPSGKIPWESIPWETLNWATAPDVPGNKVPWADLNWTEVGTVPSANIPWDQLPGTDIPWDEAPDLELSDLPAIALGDLSNVSNAAPTANQVLSWDGATWAPATVSTGGGSSSTPFSLAAGDYLDGASFDGSTAVTWNVQGATANTANALVARDANGDISVGVCSATQLTSTGEISGTDVNCDSITSTGAINCLSITATAKVQAAGYRIDLLPDLP